MSAFDWTEHVCVGDILYAEAAQELPIVVRERPGETVTTLPAGGYRVLAVAPSSIEVERVDLCRGCKQEIDPDMCWCGSPVDGHENGMHWLGNHPFIPIGCVCHMEEIPDLD